MRTMGAQKSARLETPLVTVAEDASDEVDEKRYGSAAAVEMEVPEEQQVEQMKKGG